MARRMGRLRTQTVSANVRQETDIQLLKVFKARCAASGATVQSVILCHIREWLHPHQGGHQ